jgi:hypothetical protein
MFQSYFIHFHFANPVVFPEFTRWNESAQQKSEAISPIHALRGQELLLICWGFGRHSAVATQKTIHAPPRACKSPAEERAKCAAMG